MSSPLPNLIKSAIVPLATLRENLPALIAAAQAQNDGLEWHHCRVYMQLSIQDENYMLHDDHVRFITMAQPQNVATLLAALDAAEAEKATLQAQVDAAVAELADIKSKSESTDARLKAITDKLGITVPPPSQ